MGRLSICRICLKRILLNSSSRYNFLSKITCLLTRQARTDKVLGVSICATQQKFYVKNAVTSSFPTERRDVSRSALITCLKRILLNSSSRYNFLSKITRTDRVLGVSIRLNTGYNFLSKITVY